MVTIAERFMREPPGGWGAIAASLAKVASKEESVSKAYATMQNEGMEAVTKAKDPAEQKRLTEYHDANIAKRMAKYKAHGVNTDKSKSSVKPTSRFSDELATGSKAHGRFVRDRSGWNK